MRLHELKENKVYIGEDGKEYAINGIYLRCLFDDRFADDLPTFSQNFTPKKEKRIVEKRGWLNKYPHWRSDRYHATKESADMNASSDRIACIEMVGTYEIEVEE